MTDQRNVKLAKILVDYSVKVKPKDKVAITCHAPEGLPLAKEVYKAVLLKKGLPYLELAPGDLQYFYFKHATLEQIKTKPEISLFVANWADKFVSIVADKNDRELANVDHHKVLVKTKINEPVREIIMKKPWVLTYFPTFSMAHSASLSLEELEEFYYKACIRDWEKEAQKLNTLKKLLDKAETIRVIGKNTNLLLSLKGRNFEVCAGKYNMPDGEVFGCPLETQTEGHIYFDFPSIYQGKVVEGAYFEFIKGRVVKYDARSHKEFLGHTLNLDQGAKTLGEFAIGTNYGITQCMLNTLFDEKIGGTIHLALGCAYEENKDGGGKNKSAIHWDFVKDMRIKGSQVIADGKIVLKDGQIFV